MAIINGTAGNDVLHGTNGYDQLRGFAGADQFFDSAQADQFFGGTGKDTFHLETGQGADYVKGGAGADTIYIDLSDPNGPNGVKHLSDLGYGHDQVIFLNNNGSLDYHAEAGDAHNSWTYDFDDGRGDVEVAFNGGNYEPLLHSGDGWFF